MITCATGDACRSLLDGLIGFDGSPQLPYWVMRAYSDMSGSRLASSASGSNLYTLATLDDSRRTIEALIGRADACYGGDQCPQFHAPSKGPVRLSLSVAIPWDVRAVDVSVQVFPDSASNPIGRNDVPSEPQATVRRAVAGVDGVVRIPIRSFNDGEALYLTRHPSSCSFSFRRLR